MTSLVQTGSNFFMYNINNGAGPELKYGGTPFTAGEFGAYALIGAEAVSANTYDIAFKIPGSSTFVVWSTDANGNITTNVTGTVSGTSTALEGLEPSFNQDLNGDGVIGIPAHTSTAQTVTSDSQAASAASVAPITAPSSGNAILAGTAAADTFVFNAHFGNDTVTGFQPGVDQVDVDHTLFANISNLLSHTADNAAGSAVVTIAADQSITFDHVSKLLLQQHASDFHLM